MIYPSYPDIEKNKLEHIILIWHIVKQAVLKLF